MHMQSTSAERQFADSLIERLDTEIELSERLLAVIGREQLQMEQPLQAATEEQLQHKLELLQQLQQASEQRMALMQSHGFDPDPKGVAACCAACAWQPELALRFQRLTRVARDCHAANQRLGLLLNRKSSFFARLMGSLSGNSQPQLYQSNGYCDPASVNLRHRLSV
jgi:flagellar biosynthesis/type III secretory pathway chaperone